jgi:predicted ATPase/DNA-binding winged helix-turn-helix (wHTH) protein/Tol biopolymer transport system component
MENQMKTYFSFGEFELDANRRLLLKQGKIVNLNPKALDLLLTLVENCGRVVSKDELLDRVWANQFVEENNLTVHIAALRKALGEKKNEHRYIVTVPGKGYNFVAKVQSVSCEESKTTRNGENSPVEISDSNGVSNTNQSVLSTNRKSNLLPASAENFDVCESLVGREREVREIVNLLRGESANLITLTGAGGTGKTSLARAVAGDVAADFPDGVFFVELAAVTDAELVIPTIAQIVHVKESIGISLIDALKNFLRERRTLIVLDNFEQLISAAPRLKELLTSTSLLKILVTSRAALRIKDEREFAVLPLAVPPRETAFAADELNRYAAIALFVRRAQTAKPNFVLTDENAPVVAAICHKLDGLPLAIELAAARIKLLAPQAILIRLENSLKLLTGGAKDLPSRQRTMRGTIEWSYELLDENEKNLFRRLAVFAGGFSVEAAEIINLNPRLEAYSSENDEPDVDVLDGIASLIDKNLLSPIEQADGSTRLRMLEVVREFALEKLQASNKFEFFQRNHARYFLALAETAAPHLIDEQAVEWLEKLESEHDNFRAALGWSSKHDAEIMARTAAALRYFWSNHNHLTEGRNWLESAFERCVDAAPAIRLKLLNGIGQFARSQGDYAAARKAYEESLAAGKSANDLQQLVVSYHGLAALATRHGDFAAAREYTEKQLAITRRLNDESQIAVALSALGDIELASGATTTARPLIEESLAISRQLGNRQLETVNLVNLGAVAFDLKDYSAANRHFAESLTIAQELGNKIFISCSLDGCAALAAAAGYAEQSARLAGAAENLRESIGYEIELTERRFRDAYIPKIRRCLDEETFTAELEQGKLLNLSDAVALARTLPGNGANGSQRSEFFSDPSEQSEIIIENHSFSRIIIEDTVEVEPAHKIIESEKTASKTAENIIGLLPKVIYLSLAAVLLAGLLVFWIWNSGNSANGMQFNLVRLTTSGKVTNATLTPDSKYAVFSQMETDGESLWLRHISTGSQKQILPVQPVRFVGLAMSPDGDTIYATIFSPALADPQIWRVPILGGSTEEIKEIKTGAAVSFSPDGSKIAFIESRSALNENHLLVSEANGANKKLLSRAKGDSRSFSNFNANPVAWSPDGDEIACAVHEKTETGALKAGILLINPADGRERFITERRWDFVEHLTWTDAENLAFIAYTSDPWQGQIWTVSNRTGDARQITNDLNSYSWLGSASGNLLTVQKNAVSHVSIGDFDGKNNQIEMREIFKESGAIDNTAWAADGAILFSSSASGKREIWRINSDGSNPQQLTSGANVALGFAVSPADGSIVFCSAENGKYSLKLADADGKNVRPLTEGTEDVYPNFAPDGQTVIFQRGFKDKLITLWSVSLADGNLVQITRTHGTHPTISPDGTQAAHYFMDAETDNLWRIRLVSIVDGTPLGKLSFPKAVTERRMRWHPGGRFIGQVFYEGENIKLLLVPTDGGESQIVNGLGKGDVNRFEWSRDGRQIVISHTTETQDAVFLSK